MSALMLPPITVLPERVEVAAALSRHGYRVTSPRAAVIDAVLGHDRPFTAEQLVAELGGG
ncbi:MAG: transcriptional repressor, partial [Chloroflexia bacterium]|nr:transcriptional repressor [Chloroflexia bacterium]